MAVEKDTSMTAGRRRLVFGGNVVLMVVVALALTVLVNFMVTRLSPGPADLTTGGRFSLSQRTLKLLKGLEEPIRLTALYRVGEQDEQGREQLRRVKDLLRRYSGVTGKVQYEVIDPLKDNRAKSKLVQRLIEKYSGESEKHRQVVEHFKDTIDKIVNLLRSERETIKELAGKSETLDRNRNIVAIYYRFGRDFADAQAAVDDVNELIGGMDIPRYSDAVEIITRLYENVKNDLEAAGDYFSDETGQELQGLSDQARQFFRGARQRYQALVTDLTEKLEQFKDLPKLELEQIYDSVKRQDAKVVVVEAKDKAKVLNYYDVWQFRRQMPGEQDGPKYDFNGEAAISTAILSLTQKDKAAVVFIHAGGNSPISPSFTSMQMSRAPFRMAKEKLEEGNFIVKAWDITKSDDPPKIEEASRVVYVVMPPSRQRPQRPGMPPPPGYEKKQIDIIKRILDDGGRMIFLASFTPMMAGRPWPFKEMLKEKYGVEVMTDTLALTGMRVRNKIIPGDTVMVSRYEDHEITTPVQSYQSSFQAAVPIKIAEELPKGVEVKPLVRLTRQMGRYWGETDIMKLMSQRWAEEDDKDVKAPFDLAVAATAEDGSKVVVFGNDSFASDAVANQSRYVLTAQGLGAIPVNPGNLELFANSAFWLNDNANLIAVGPRSGDVPRIRNISEEGMMAWKAFIWVILPLAVLVVGGVVYFVRSR